MVKQMSETTFFKRLREAAIKKPFTIGKDYKGDRVLIRQCNTRDCAVTAVARLVTGTRFDTVDTDDAAEAIGLDPELAECIVSASDAQQEKNDNPERYRLRRKLLRTLDLQERAEKDICRKGKKDSCCV